MINYMPERIYEKVKDDPQYKNIVNAITNLKNACTTFEQYIESDSGAFYGDQGAIYKTQLENLVNEYCPQYIDEYKASDNQFTVEQLLNMYNSNTYDDESDLFFLSKILGNTTFQNNSYIQYLDKYTKRYEAINNTELSSLSNYINLKYMYSKIFMITYEWNCFEDGFCANLFKQVQAVYNTTLQYTKDPDITNNYAIEALTDSVQIISNKVMNDKLTLPYLTLVLNFAEGLEYQYKDYSFGYAKLLDLDAMYCAYTRDFDGFINGVITICKYLSTAMAVPSKVIKGLNYYDKCNHTLFIILIRKYIKLKNSIPALRNNSNVIINNLSVDDYNFAISDVTKTFSPNLNNTEAVGLFINTIDLWFNSSNAVYNQLKSIKF